MTRLGELAALGAALSWTVNSLLIERLGRGLSPWAMNLMTKSGGLVAVSLLSLILNGTLIPLATGNQWLLLLLSGFVGFSIGDVFLYKGFQELGARRTMLVFSANPIITAVFGWILFGEGVEPLQIAGIILAVFGIMLVIRGDVPAENQKTRGKAILYAVFAALGQAGGVLLSKAGLADVDAVTGAQIRLIGGAAGMALLLSVFRKWGSVPVMARSAQGWRMVGTNVVLGTLIGMVLSLYAIKNTQVAVASILTSLTPVMILPISAIFLREKVSLYEAAGAGVTVLGVSLLFL